MVDYSEAEVWGREGIIVKGRGDGWNGVTGVVDVWITRAVYRIWINSCLYEVWRSGVYKTKRVGEKKCYIE